MKRAGLSALVKNTALESGFDLSGIANPDNSHEEEHLKMWLYQSYNADMEYFYKKISLRLGKESPFKQIKSVIICAKNYYAAEKNPFFARYICARDYHYLLKERLSVLLQGLTDKIGKFSYQIFVDTSPVMEKRLAFKAGLGFIGKNSLLINPQYGSFLWLGGAYTSLDLEYDSPLDFDGCGTCKKCVECCATGALNKPYVLDARKCISYWTTNFKGKDLPFQIKAALCTKVFGCDTCQDVCPYNHKIKAEDVAPLYPESSIDDLKAMAKESFKKYFGGTAIYSYGKKRILRNIEAVRGKAVLKSFL